MRINFKNSRKQRLQDCSFYCTQHIDAALDKIVDTIIILHKICLQCNKGRKMASSNSNFINLQNEKPIKFFSVAC